MGKVSIVKRKDGGVCIAPIAREQRPDETDAEFLHACTKRITKEPISPGFGGEVIGIFDDSIVIQDRYFRGAWTWNTPEPKVDIDLEKARSIHTDNLRLKRAPMLEKLDAAYMRADENGDTAEKMRITSEKQRLRDFPTDTRLVNAKTPDEIRSFDI